MRKIILTMNEVHYTVYERTEISWFQKYLIFFDTRFAFLLFSFDLTSLSSRIKIVTINNLITYTQGQCTNIYNALGISRYLHFNNKLAFTRQLAM